MFLGIPTEDYLPPGANLFGTRKLKKGSYGYDVWVLQNRLATTAQKYADALGAPATKYFDNRTEMAVKIFQRDVHLVDDGIVGPRPYTRYITMLEWEAGFYKRVFGIEVRDMMFIGSRKTCRLWDFILAPWTHFLALLPGKG